MRVRDLYAEHRSPLCWSVVLLGAWAAACLVRVTVSRVMFPAWLSCNLGRSVGYWLLGTPLARISPEVRFFVTIYLPDGVTLFCVGVILGMLFDRHWKQLALMFAFAFHVFSDAAGVSPLSQLIAHVQVAEWGRSLAFGSYTLVLFALLFLGCYVGARWFARKPPPEGHCAGCGYNLRELTSRVCPECGRAFDASPARQRVPTSLEPLPEKRTPAAFLARRAFLYRLLVAGLTLTMFYAFDWMVLREFLCASLQGAFSFMGHTAEQSVYDRSPLIVVDGCSCKLTPHCTMLDLLLVLLPFAWARHVGITQNLRRLAVLAAGVCAVNFLRICSAIYLNTQGVSWSYAHDVPYLLIYSVFVMLAFRKAACEGVAGSYESRVAMAI